ncbi:MAG: nondiscriminating glutamyl-tRNA synthetase [Candidatus Atribacteria bacterium]|nr:nondiscriminating glutamyl-tRNA synthetase [Candidatus Atribacteria bacterium]
MNEIRTRFAPSPTGFLHIGGARTAAFNWAFARQQGGALVVRMEDTDLKRSRLEFEKEILADLEWLGIDWDEGPNRGGKFGPYRQSERLDLYRFYFEELKKRGYLYPCYCSPEQLKEERRKMLEAGQAPRYSGRCYFLSPAEREKLEREGTTPSWRFHISENKEITFEDLVRGKMVFHTQSLGDFVVFKSDGMPTYNFACVVDDNLMKISHVIRGEEHLSNTPYQILLGQALGWEMPTYVHVPIILDENRAKLSKRKGDVSLKFFREEGFLPQAILNFLFLLGHSFPEEELVPPAQIPANFSLKRVSKAGAVFNQSKLSWLNGIYLRCLSPQELEKTLFDQGFGEYLPRIRKKLGDPRFYLFLSLVSEDSTTLKEIAGKMRDYLEVSPVVSSLEKEEREAISVIVSSFSLPLSSFEDEEAIKKDLRKWQKKTGLPPRLFFQSLRFLLIGKKEGPELNRLLVALGPEVVKEKLTINRFAE